MINPNQVKLPNMAGDIFTSRDHTKCLLEIRSPALRHRPGRLLGTFRRFEGILRLGGSVAGPKGRECSADATGQGIRNAVFEPKLMNIEALVSFNLI